jgi:hypothetical protein
MKKFLLSCSILSCFILAGCSAGVVTTRPADVVYVRSASPGPGHVWVTGDWVYSHGKYHWREGYWHTSRPGSAWKSGYWEKDHDGYRWQKGRWQ